MIDAALLVEPVTRAERWRFAFADAVAATGRFVRRARRQPDLVIGGIVMPIIFVVLFGYVFGSSIDVPGGNYRTYLMSGLFAQSTLWSSTSVAVAVATDVSEGVVDRFRTLPITRSSFLLGRTLATVIVGLPGLAVMIVCALVVGWSPAAGVPNAIAGFALLSLFGFAMGWIGVLIGLFARGPQAADVIGMLPAFILGFVSNVFVDTARMPEWLRVVANWNPVSAVVAAARQLFGTAQGTAAHQVWSQAHPVLATLGISVLILAICVPLGVRMYSRRER